MKTRTLRGLPRTDAEDRILQAIVSEAFAARKSGDDNLADAIEILGAKIASRYGVTHKPGLPETFPAAGLKS